MNFGDFFSTTASKAGIANDNQELKTFLSDARISAIEIPDSIVSHIQSNYFTIEAAKNNPTVLASARAQVLNGVDSELNRSLEQYNLDDALKAELTAEKSSTKRMALAINKLVELERSKAGANKGDKAELQKEIDSLRTQMKTASEGYTAKELALIEQHQSDILNYDLKTILSGYNYALPKEMANEVKVETAMMLLNRDLKGKDAKFIRENGVLKLKKASADLDYYDDKNSKVEPKAFIDSVLAQNNLLAVNDNSNGATTAPVTTIVASSKGNTSKTYQDALDRSMAELGGI